MTQHDAQESPDASGTEQDLPAVSGRETEGSDLIPTETPRVLFDRLNERIGQEQATGVPSPGYPALDTLGRFIRRWRLRKGHSRRRLAAHLALAPSRLLLIESGIGQPGEISAEQLARLSALVAADGADPELAAAIAAYVAALRL